MKWYADDYSLILRHLAASKTLTQARESMRAESGKSYDPSSITHAFRDRGWQPASYYLDRPERVAPLLSALSGAGMGTARPVGHAERPCATDAAVGAVGQYRRVDGGIEEPMPDPRAKGFDALLKATRKPIDFARLCDVLDMSPTRVRGLVSDAQAQGYTVQVAGDAIGWREPEASNDLREIAAPAKGEWTRIAVASDWHAGSKYCLRHYIADFQTRAREWCGERTIILSAGDQVDGAYEHGKWELSHHGLEEQTEDFLDIYKPHKGQDLYYIDGNHDETFWRQTGYPTGKAIEDAARARGRTDLHYLGARGAMISIGGVKISLWHPKPKKGYALSYPLQNYIRDIPLGHKPDILLAGHWHSRSYFEQRGIHAFGCPTFQGGGSSFGKSLGGAPSIGGWLIAWRRTEHGTLREIDIKPISYYEHEQPREVA